MEWWNECSGEIIFAGRFLKNSLKYSNIYGPALTNYRLPRYAKIIWLLHRFSFFTDSLKYESSLLRVYACVTRELSATRRGIDYVLLRRTSSTRGTIQK